MADRDLPSVTDVHISGIREPSKLHQRLEPVLQITRKGTRELRIREHAVLFIGLGVSIFVLGPKIMLDDMVFGQGAPAMWSEASR